MKHTSKLNIIKRSRNEVLELLQQDENLWQKFCQFPEKYQEELILFCMGKQGLRITYDSVFKYIFSPEKNKKRLEEFISSVLREKVEILQVLQHEGIQMLEKGSFVIMDVVVRLRDGRLLNVEMQKIGYHFPAERTDCYLADLVMRQYNDLKRNQGDKFDFRDMSKVMSIVIMEQSSKAFHQKRDFYIHQGKMQYDSGIILDDLFENIYISLDTFKYLYHRTKRITCKKEAWMLFLASTELDDILAVCEYAPEFIAIYQEVFEFGKDVKEFVSTFSDSLRETDRNAERIIVEEMKAELRQKEEENRRYKEEYRQYEKEYKQRKKEYTQREMEYRQQAEEMQKKLKEAYAEIEYLKANQQSKNKG